MTKNKMTEKEWIELESEAVGKRELELINKTEKEDEHPDWYDGPCACRFCMSYGN